MIAKIKGTLNLIIKNSAIIETSGGVGYKIFLSDIAIGRLSIKNKSEQISLFIFTYVREDQITLYGFETLGELEMFELLLSVSGVGPKAAMAILNIASPGIIKSSVNQDDAGILTRVPGIGKKTAQKIVIELKNKIDKISVDKDSENEDKSAMENQEVLEALIAMGYSTAQAIEAVKKIPTDLLDISDKIKFALKGMAK